MFDGRSKLCLSLATIFPTRAVTTANQVEGCRDFFFKFRRAVTRHTWHSASMKLFAGSCFMSIPLHFSQSAAHVWRTLAIAFSPSVSFAVCLRKTRNKRNRRARKKRKVPTMPAERDSGSHIRALRTPNGVSSERVASLTIRGIIETTTTTLQLLGRRSHSITHNQNTMRVRRNEVPVITRISPSAQIGSYFLSHCVPNPCPSHNSVDRLGQTCSLKMDFN